MSVPVRLRTILPPAVAALLRVMALWRRRAPGLAIGIAASLLAFLFLVTLLATSGMRLAGTGAGLLLGSVLLLRLLGLGRVVLRYGERLLTHDAMFRALADLRVWFFRRLAGSAAGGLGHRRSGDLLSRLVGDVEALDGLYLRIAVPLAGAGLALPLLVALAARHDAGLALLIGIAFATAVLLLPQAAD